MEFNPLDLLASAAELQQKHDGPERIIVTRQRRNTANTSKHAVSAGGQKENREIHSNNNNNTVKTKPRPSVVIVKKIKVDNKNPELEKMFDEHNYGNSKKNNNNNTTKSDNIEQDLNKGNKRNDNSTGSIESQSATSDTVISELENGENKVTTLISVSSHAAESDIEQRVGKHTVNSSGDKSTCSTGVQCTSNETPTKLENETREDKCTCLKETVCNCGSLPVERTDSIGQSEVNSTHSVDRPCKQQMVMKYNKDSIIEKVILARSSSSLDLHKSDIERLKLDDKTGEFTTTSGAKVIVKSFVDGKINNEKRFENSEKRKSSTEEKVIHKMVAVKNLKNLKPDSSNGVKSTSAITSAKMPYVKVIPSKDISSEATLDKKPETLVINISRGQSSSNQLTKSVLDDQSSQQCDTNKVTSSDYKTDPTKSSNSVGVIKSIVVSEKEESSRKGQVTLNKPKPMVCTMLPSKSKLEMPNVDSSRFHSTAACESLKALELSTNTICSDVSVSSVHLLSPDRRNPDSVGIVEIPVIHNGEELHSDDKNTDLVTFPFPHPNNNSNNTKSINEKGDNNNSGGLVKEHEETSVICDNGLKTDSDCNTTSSMDLSENIKDTGSDTRELVEESRLDSGNTVNNGDNNANDDSLTDTSGNEVPIFRFDSDHCYAGPASSEGNKQQTLQETEEPCTPMGSTSELSQDSGYGDVGQSPGTDTSHLPQAQTVITTEKPVPLPSTSVSSQSVMKNLVPVLVSVNTNGSLTLHDANLTKLGAPVLAIQDKLPTTGIKVIPGTSLTASGTTPLILSPIGKATPPIVADNKKIIQTKSKGPESIIELLCQKTPDKNRAISMVQTSQQVSPPKFGTFKIGTFASFTNTGMDVDNNKTPMKSEFNIEEKLYKPKSRPRSNSGKSLPAASESLNTLVQKVKGNLSQSLPTVPTESQYLDHIQHDHDYCTKNLMPSVVSSLLEARLLSKDNLGKVKVPHGRGKKSEHEHVREYHRSESRSGKRKHNSASLTKLDSMDDFDIDSESDTQSVHEQPKSKSRLEKYLEKPGRTTDPKVKITGSSNFQDQFVYFMNTKKRSRRRESKDMPLALGDRLIIPPKPGDIVVPHLTDQDIENLKIRSKQFKQSGNVAGFNSLRNEFMAAKYANTPYSGLFSSSEPPAAMDEEKNIINTILSMENENLASPVQSEPPSYNESMEMYGQGLGNDIMSLLPEQMNLTQEQMDLLYSAVDEVQNSSPGLIGAEKLVSTESDNSFSQFPIPDFESDPADKTEDKGDKSVVGATEIVTMEESDSKTETEKSTKEATNGDAEPKDDKVEVTKMEVSDSPSSQDKAKQTDDTKQETPSTEVEKTEEIAAEDKPEATDDVVKSDDKSETGPEKMETETNNLESEASQISSPTMALPTSQASLPISSVASIINSVSDSQSSLSVQNNSASLFPSSDTSLRNSTTVPAEMSNTNSAINTSDIPLDILGLDNYKNDLFSDSSVQQLPTTNSVPTVQTRPQTATEYAAPWIVTVSMFWNDLPAIMLNNHPYVRLVDIHKQILPAKDTGILKKRCQLMGIVVENCNEMQRYFLVQYGKAFNSKSTLIISQDNAKELIGYYVNPQPKASRLDDHKSIISHRREQLRRIALARRAAMRSQRVEKKNDPREIKSEEKVPTSDQQTPPCLAESTPRQEPVAKISAPAVAVKPTRGTSVRSQHATRHKKINFLEMLRGDSMNSVDDDNNETSDKPQKLKTKADTETRGRKKKVVEDKKVKAIQYTIETETDSSEETDSVESDYASSYDDTDTTSDSDITMISRPQKFIAPKLNGKSKIKVIPYTKPYGRQLKVKIAGNRPRSTSLTSTPVTLQAPGKNKLNGVKSPDTSPVLVDDPLDSGVLKGSVPLVFGKKVAENSEGDSRVVNHNSDHDLNAEKNIVTPDLFLPKSINIEEKDLKVSPTLPDEILETSETVSNENSQEDLDSVETNNEVTAISDGLSESNNVTKSSDSTDSGVHAVSPLSVLKGKELVRAVGDETPLRIIHRDASPQTQPRTRSQLGEVFVDRYHNKKSVCIRCYTCRKLMTVDSFLRHLHDVVSGGLMAVTAARTVDITNEELTVRERKLWETFQRKKELFDNNQIPSPELMAESLVYNMDSEESNHSLSESPITEKDKKPPGPRIIKTPVSPVHKKAKIVRKSDPKLPVNITKLTGSGSKIVPKTSPIDSAEGVRSSGRKRKVKQLYPFEEYSFTKFPRLMRNTEDNSGV